VFFFVSVRENVKMPLFHEETDTAEFDQFMQNMPRDSVSVCGKTYKCHSTATGDVFWSSDPKSAGHSSRDCNVDMLVAAAHANNCNVSRQYKSIPANCLRENPILTNDKDGTSVQVRDNATYDMPSIVEAHWKCVAKGVVNEGTHDPSHVEDHGGVALLHLKVETSAPTPTPTPTSTPFNNSMTPDESSRMWTTCSLSGREQKRACNVDADCPLMDDRLNDMLLSRSRELNIDMSKGLQHFMKSIRNTLSPDVAWTATRAKALEGFSRTEAGVKSSVGTLLSTDATFRESVRTMIERDPDFSALRESARSGSCTTQGKCMSSTVTPTSRLYDGTNDVSFSMLDNKVMYTRNGVVREAEALKCVGDRKKECDLITEVVEGGDSLSLGGKPMTAAYRLRFAGVESEYMVLNNVNVKNETECSARLCEHNTASCPSTLCQLTDEKKCVPRNV
jgi:hypothetical protein